MEQRTFSCVLMVVQLSPCRADERRLDLWRCSPSSSLCLTISELRMVLAISCRVFSAEDSSNICLQQDREREKFVRLQCYSVAASSGGCKMFFGLKNFSGVKFDDFAHDKLLDGRRRNAMLPTFI